MTEKPTFNLEKEILGLRKDLKIIVWESHLQTLAVIAGALAFFWGVSTVIDLKKKIK